MLIIAIIALFVFTYAISLIVMILSTEIIRRQAQNLQLPLFVALSVLFLTPVFSAIVIAAFPVPMPFALIGAIYIGDLQEIYRIISVTGPLNIFMPIITGIIAYQVGPKFL